MNPLKGATWIDSLSYKSQLTWSSSSSSMWQHSFLSLFSSLHLVMSANPRQLVFLRFSFTFICFFFVWCPLWRVLGGWVKIFHPQNWGDLLCVVSSLSSARRSVVWTSAKWKLNFHRNSSVDTQTIKLKWIWLNSILSLSLAHIVALNATVRDCKMSNWAGREWICCDRDTFEHWKSRIFTSLFFSADSPSGVASYIEK